MMIDGFEPSKISKFSVDGQPKGYEGMLYPTDPQTATRYLQAAELVKDQGIRVSVFPDDEQGNEAAIVESAAHHMRSDSEDAARKRVRYSYLRSPNRPTEIIAQPVTVLSPEVYRCNAEDNVNRARVGGGAVLKITVDSPNGSTSPFYEALKQLEDQ
jgi:hypothetical protein